MQLKKLLLVSSIFWVGCQNAPFGTFEKPVVNPSTSPAPFQSEGAWIQQEFAAEVRSSEGVRRCGEQNPELPQILSVSAAGDVLSKDNNFKESEFLGSLESNQDAHAHPFSRPLVILAGVQGDTLIARLASASGEKEIVYVRSTAEEVAKAFDQRAACEAKLVASRQELPSHQVGETPTSSGAETLHEEETAALEEEQNIELANEAVQARGEIREALASEAPGLWRHPAARAAVIAGGGAGYHFYARHVSDQERKTFQEEMPDKLAKADQASQDKWNELKTRFATDPSAEDDIRKTLSAHKLEVEGEMYIDHLKAQRVEAAGEDTTLARKATDSAAGTEAHLLERINRQNSRILQGELDSIGPKGRRTAAVVGLGLAALAAWHYWGPDREGVTELLAKDADLQTLVEMDSAQFRAHVEESPADARLIIDFASQIKQAK